MSTPSSITVAADLPFPLTENAGYCAEASELEIKPGAKYPDYIHHKGLTYRFSSFRASDRTAIYLTTDNKRFEILND